MHVFDYLLPQITAWRVTLLRKTWVWGAVFKSGLTVEATGKV